MKHTRKTMLIVLLGFGGCMGQSSDDMTSLGAPKSPIEIVESDLYQHDEKRQLLYVHNEVTGLNVIDVSNHREPELLGRAKVVGKGGELYLQKTHAVILLEQATAACRRPDDLTGSSTDGAEIVIVDVAKPSSPRTIARYCGPGVRVASRMINDFLFFVTSSEQNGSRVYSFDLSDPENMTTVQRVVLPWKSKEVHVTADRIFVVGPSAMPTTTWLEAPDMVYPSAETHTRVQVISTSATTGRLNVGGDIVLDGLPQGRFHIDARDDQLRIVTYASVDLNSRGQSILHVVDVSEPDKPRSIGRLDEIGTGERLFATHFVDDRAYVVTFRQIDPLWVIDLSDPSDPRIIGELHVPGWSDFIFPRGDRLLCVGRSGGGGVGVSLFDLSDPREPKVIEQLQVGSWNSQSEANMDHRAVTIIEDRNDSERFPLLVLPYSGYDYNCSEQHRVSLIEITDEGLSQRGELSQRGAVLRTLKVDASLLSISEVELQSFDIADLDAPKTQTSLTLGTSEQQAPARYCAMMEDEHRMFGCDLTGSNATAPPFLLLVALALILWRRRKCPSKK